MTPESEIQPEILFERRGAAGFVTLNRPRALNAVTLGMVRQLRGQLDAWRDDPAVTRVVVTGGGGKAFSAGGDIRSLYELGRSGHAAEAMTFWREEYQLNSVIKRYPKPYVSLIDGIVMGGGVGLSVHGSHRVAGDRFSFAMPEVGIGFFPDIGATWFLPRMPGQLGVLCALAATRLGAADAVASRIATHRVPSARLPDLIDGLSGTVSVDALLGAFSETSEAGPVTAQRPAIDRLLVGERVEAILARLDVETGADADWARATAATIRAQAPLSCKIALAQIRRGAEWSFEKCLQAEYRIVSRIVYGHEFYEGVRAAIIDKDNQPRWRPASLAEVGDAEVERHFAPLPPDQELQLP